MNPPVQGADGAGTDRRPPPATGAVSETWLLARRTSPSLGGMRRPVRNAFLLGLVVGLVIAIVRALRVEGSGPDAVGAGAPPLPAPTASPEPVEDRVTSTSVPGPAPEPAATPSSGEPPPDVVPPVAADPVPDEPARADPASGAEAATWEEPVGGACPPGFPVKARESSGIYHVPGGAFYERTTPDRCYPTAETAETDGFRSSKR